MGLLGSPRGSHVAQWQDSKMARTCIRSMAVAETGEKRCESDWDYGLWLDGSW